MPKSCRLLYLMRTDFASEEKILLAKTQAHCFSPCFKIAIFMIEGLMFASGWNKVKH